MKLIFLRIELLKRNVIPEKEAKKRVRKVSKVFHLNKFTL